MRAEVPAYERLQQAVAEATVDLTVARVLDLGTGTGETLGAVLEAHPGAVAVGVDKNEAMLERPTAAWPGSRSGYRRPT